MSSERARLTVLYTGLLVLSGVLLTGLVYLLLEQGLESRINVAVTRVVPGHKVEPKGKGDPTRPEHSTDSAESPRTTELLGRAGRARPARAGDVESQRAAKVSNAAGSATLSRLLTVSGVSLAAFTVVSAGLAWWMVGRILRPVGVITARARRLSEANLHERLALRAPRGEFKELADTFDQMLDRIEQLIAARQRFAANAAHELRTSVAVQRAAAEIGLANNPPRDRVVRLRRKLIENADSSQQLIESLLLLAVSDRELANREPVALHKTTAGCAADLRDSAAQRSVALEVAAEPLFVEGDAVLLEHAVHNLISNGIRYNRAGGSVRVRVGAEGVEVVNSGPVVPPADVPALFEPFRRAEQRSRGPGEGAGLGLSIVASIVRAHGARVRARANPEGGLAVRLVFPTA